MAFQRTLVDEQLRVDIGEVGLNRKAYGGLEACLAKQCLTLLPNGLRCNPRLLRISRAASVPSKLKQQE